MTLSGSIETVRRDSEEFLEKLRNSHLVEYHDQAPGKQK
jgi:hypothetical protein